MSENNESKQYWNNPESPSHISRECFPPLGISHLQPHHFKWWRRPFFHRWWCWFFPSCACCCCCCDHRSDPVPERSCFIDLQLEANTFGPGRSIHIVAAPGVYFAEFYLTWNASGSSGQVTVDLELVSGPVPTPQLLADNRGPNDRYLFSTNQPGSYLFRATATDAQGNTCFDTLQVDVPAI